MPASGRCGHTGRESFTQHYIVVIDLEEEAGSAVPLGQGKCPVIRGRDGRSPVAVAPPAEKALPRGGTILGKECPFSQCPPSSGGLPATSGGRTGYASKAVYLLPVMVLSGFSCCLVRGVLPLAVVLPAAESSWYGGRIAGRYASRQNN